MSKPWEVHHEAEGQGKQENFTSLLENQPLIKKRRPLRYDFLGFFSSLRELQDTFGHRLLVLLFVVQHLLKGFVLDFSHKAVPYMFKYYSVPAPQAQVFTGVMQLPWAMKPMIGVVSDIFPIWGYNKAPYMAITCVLGAAAFAILGNLSSEVIPVGMAVMCFFVTKVQTSTCDLLSEAKYSAKIKLNPSQGPKLVAYVWFGQQVGALVSVAAAGVILKYFGFRCVFLICIVPAGILLVPLLGGYTEEACVSDEMKAVTRQRFFEQPEVGFLASIMFAGTVTLAVAGVALHSVLVNCILAISVGAVVLVSFSLLLTPSIAKLNAFCLLQASFSLSIGGAAFYFFTDTEEQYPRGPNFSKFFYNSILGAVGPCAGIIGIWSYRRWLSKWNFRTLIVFTSVVQATLNSLDIVLFTRANVDYLGIPDAGFILGASAMDTVIAMWHWMPQCLVLSYMVPEGMESTMFGLLAGCQNLGSAIATSCGALLLESLHVRPSGAIGEQDMFDNLWIASAVSTVTPLLCACTLFWLIPNLPQTECFKDEDAESPVAGSLWRQWTKQTDQVDWTIQITPSAA